MDTSTRVRGLDQDTGILEVELRFKVCRPPRTTVDRCIVKLPRGHDRNTDISVHRTLIHESASSLLQVVGMQPPKPAEFSGK